MLALFVIASAADANTQTPSRFPFRRAPPTALPDQGLFVTLSIV